MPAENVEPGRERRRYLRIPRLLLILYVEENRQEPDPGIIVDLGLGGARLLTRMSLPENRKVTLILELEEDNPIQVEGRITWTRNAVENEDTLPFVDDAKYYHGVEFQAVPADVMNKIVDYLDFSTNRKNEQANLSAREDFYMEHRKFFRRPVNIRISCWDQNGEPFILDCKALSLGGLMFVSKRLMERDEVIRLTLPIQESLLELKGKVVWLSLLTGGTTQEGGLRFLDIEDEQKEKILLFITTVEGV